MPTERERRNYEFEPPDSLPRGWLADKLRERTVRSKIDDPEERQRMIQHANLKLGPGANTLPRRGRRY